MSDFGTPRSFQFGSYICIRPIGLQPDFSVWLDVKMENYGMHIPFSVPNQVSPTGNDYALYRQLLDSQHFAYYTAKQLRVFPTS